MNRTLALLCASLLYAGCAHDRSLSQQAGDATAAVGSSLEDAYDAVASGAKTSARWGEYVVDRIGAGAVRVYRAAAGKTRVAGRDVSDAAISAQVMGALNQDAEVSGRDIKVSTDAGVVTLSGEVRNRREASRAVQDALGTQGVFAVDSSLHWPGGSSGDTSGGNDTSTGNGSDDHRPGGAGGP